MKAHSKRNGEHWIVRFKLTAKGVKPAKFVQLGPFHNETDAARAYNEEIVKHRGEWAWLNILPVEAA